MIYYGKEKPEHYVNNKELLEAMIVYRTKVEASYLKNFGKDLTEQPKEERAKRWADKPPIPELSWRVFSEDCYTPLIQTQFR